MSFSPHGPRSGRRFPAVVLLALLPVLPLSRSEAAPAVRLLGSAAEGIPGPAAAGRAGDYLIENGEIRVVVSGVAHALGSAMSGGRIIDAAPSGGEDFFGQSILMLTDEFPRQARYLEGEIVPPGERGNRAGVRFRGVDDRIPDIEVETEYLLGDGEPFLTVSTTYRWPFRGDQNEGIAGDRIEVGRTVPFLVYEGFLAEGEPSGEDSTVPFDLLILAGEGVTYGWWNSRSAGVSPMGEGAIRFRWKPFHVPGKGERAFTRRLYVVEGDPAALLSRVADPPLVPVTGRVRGEREEGPMPGATVEITDPTGLLVVALSGGEGRYRAFLPPGSYGARALSPAGEEGRIRRFRIDGGRPEEIDLEAPEPGVVRFAIEDEAGGPSPGRVTVRDREGRTFRRERGRAAPTAGAFSADGRGRLTLPSGGYRIYASRGIEYSRDLREIDLEGGETVDLSFRLRREVATADLVAADFSVRSVLSMDGPATAEERIDAARAEGLDVIALADLGRTPAPETVRSAEDLTVLPGEELLVGDLGRFNVFPLAPRDEIPLRGGRGAEGRAPALVFEQIRSRGGDPIIQALAPRSERYGYFHNMGVDPVTGLSTNIEFDPAFDLLEVANGRELGKAGAVLADWFHLLNLGHPIMAAGNSGSRTPLAAPVGMPRTYLDTGGSRRGEDVLAALRGGRGFFTTGPLLEFRVNGAYRPGDLVVDRDGLVELTVSVDGASWIDIDRILVFGNGAPLLEKGVPGGDRPQIARETVAIYTDTWFVAVATGSRSLDPVFTGPEGEPVLPVAVSNPVWVDFNGDGRFDAPGVP